MPPKETDEAFLPKDTETSSSSSSSSEENSRGAVASSSVAEASPGPGVVVPAVEQEERDARVFTSLRAVTAAAPAPPGVASLRTRPGDRSSAVEALPTRVWLVATAVPWSCNQRPTATGASGPPKVWPAAASTSPEDGGGAAAPRLSFSWPMRAAKATRPEGGAAGAAAGAAAGEKDDAAATDFRGPRKAHRLDAGIAGAASAHGWDSGGSGMRPKRGPR
mmetsp:Transcript_12505/g.26077  ORF Transcript_12505/g.26077 Transcript_12505/m.26077 type:complete len:220 (+) Transcript_12505:47-706(+)